MTKIIKTVCDGCDAVADKVQEAHWFAIMVYTQEPGTFGEEHDLIDLCPTCNIRWMDMQPQNWPRPA